jgi:hypothetical protein
MQAYAEPTLEDIWEEELPLWIVECSIKPPL